MKNLEVGLILMRVQAQITMVAISLQLQPKVMLAVAKKVKQKVHMDHHERVDLKLVVQPEVTGADQVAHQVHLHHLLQVAVMLDLDLEKVALPIVTEVVLEAVVQVVLLRVMQAVTQRLLHRVMIAPRDLL